MMVTGQRKHCVAVASSIGLVTRVRIVALVVVWIARGLVALGLCSFHQPTVLPPWYRGLVVTGQACQQGKEKVCTVRLTRRGKVLVATVVMLAFMVAYGYAGHIETLGY